MFGLFWRYSDRAMYICICNAVTENDIQDAVENGATRLNELRDRLNLGKGCCLCMQEARVCLNRQRNQQSCDGAVNTA